MQYKSEQIYNSYISKIACEWCGWHERLTVIEPESSQNWGKDVCANSRCSKFFKWVRDPSKKEKRQSVKHIKQNIKYCEICLRIKEFLGVANTFTEHHILSPETNPEIDNAPSNRLKLCTQCHQIVETIRRMCQTGVYKNGKK
ncbi:hypothetical protein LCGC14_1739810 [marine sediment metagenome]|uniref:HNH endonuclease n=2 Tax=root TaxID=1 RepID=A0A831VQG0_9FLAO|nr:hypothetical protein [Pricia antarctica]